MQDLSDIVAVVSCGGRRANEYLEHGYTLLKIGDWATEEDMKPMADGTPRTYVRRGVSFVVGRTADVPAWSPVEQTPDEV